MKTPKVFQTITVCTLFSTLISSSFGQSDTAVKVRTNEVGLSIGPVLLVALGSNPYNQPFGLSYKRVNGNRAYRGNFTFRPHDNNWRGFSNSTTEIADSIQTISSKTGRSTSFTGQVGYEYRFSLKKNCYLVCGADLLAQQVYGRTAIDKFVNRIDSVSNAGTANESYYYTTLSAENTFMEKSTTTQFGIGLSIGIMVPAGKRWWVSGQCRTDSFFGSTSTTSTDNVAGTTTKYKSGTFDFSQGPPLTDISVFYRF